MHRIDAIRAAFMDRCHKGSHGIGALFEENYRAADNIQRGINQSTLHKGELIMRNGMTARRYAEGFARAMGYTVEQWAGFIIGENKRIVGHVHRVEEAYQNIVASAADAGGVTDEQVETFSKLCNGRQDG